MWCVAWQAHAHSSAAATQGHLLGKRPSDCWGLCHICQQPFLWNHTVLLPILALLISGRPGRDKAKLVGTVGGLKVWGEQCSSARKPGNLSVARVNEGV